MLLLPLGFCGLALSQINSEASGSMSYLSFFGMGIGVIGLLIAPIPAVVNGSSSPRSEPQGPAMQTPARVAVASALLLILSLGLCGFTISQSNRPGPTGILIDISLIGIAAGVLGLVVAIIMAIVTATRGTSIRTPPPPRQPPPPTPPSL